MQNSIHFILFLFKEFAKQLICWFGVNHCYDLVALYCFVFALVPLTVCEVDTTQRHAGHLYKLIIYFTNEFVGFCLQLLAGSLRERGSHSWCLTE